MKNSKWKVASGMVKIEKLKSKVASSITGEMQPEDFTSDSISLLNIQMDKAMLIILMGFTEVFIGNFFLKYIYFVL